MKYCKSKQAGFTLIEMAVVLVVLGILIGGAIKGKDILQKAKVNNLASDFQFYSGLYYQYKDQNGYLASSLIDSAIEGDGTIWALFRQAGLMPKSAIDGSSDNTNPVHSFDDEFTYTHAPAEGAVFDQAYICAENVVLSAAREVDLKLDDGLAKSGNIRISTEDEVYPTTAEALAAETSLCQRL